MPTGTLCPQCGKPVMSYRRFVREAEPYKTSRCSNCDVELRRSKVVWLMLAVGGLAAGALAVFAGPYIHSRWGVGATAAMAIAYVVAFTFGLNVCGWLFIPWVPAASDGDSPSTSEGAADS